MPQQQSSKAPGYSHLLRDSVANEQYIGISPTSLEQTLRWQQREEQQSPTTLWRYRSKVLPNEFEHYSQVFDSSHPSSSYLPRTADINTRQDFQQPRQSVIKEQILSQSQRDVDESSFTKTPGKVTKTMTARKRNSGKPNIARACSNCKRAHLGCDDSRPCHRCLGLGKQDTCVDLEGKKRGRPKIRTPISEEETISNPNRPQSPKNVILQQSFSFAPNYSKSNHPEQQTQLQQSENSPEIPFARVTTIHEDTNNNLHSHQLYRQKHRDPTIIKSCVNTISPIRSASSKPPSNNSLTPTKSTDTLPENESLKSATAYLTLESSQSLICLYASENSSEVLNFDIVRILHRPLSNIVHSIDKHRIHEMYNKVTTSNFSQESTTNCHRDTMHLLTKDGPQLFSVEMRQIKNTNFTSCVIECAVQKYAHNLFEVQTLDSNERATSEIHTPSRNFCSETPLSEPFEPFSSQRLFQSNDSASSGSLLLTLGSTTDGAKWQRSPGSSLNSRSFDMLPQTNHHGFKPRSFRPVRSNSAFQLSNDNSTTSYLPNSLEISAGQEYQFDTV
ncbi:hypothetical protein HK096_007284, partial [Nowakowskiella sp. JEL0078]